MAEPTILELVDAGTYNASRLSTRFTEAAPALEEFSIQVGNFQEQTGLEVDWKFGPITEARAWQEVQIFRQNPNLGGFGQWFDSILTWPQDRPAGGGGVAGNGTTGGGGGAATGNGNGGTTGGGGGGGGGGVVPDAPAPPAQPAAKKKKKKTNMLAIGAFGLGGLLLVAVAVAPADPKPKTKAKKKKNKKRWWER